MTLTIETGDNFQVLRMHWNAETPGFRAGTFYTMATAIRNANKSPDLACTVVMGSPRCFCLGSDADGFLEDDLEALSEEVLDFFTALATSKKPLIAAVDGIALGLGVTMLTHFDAIFATPESRFEAPFVDWGLVPEAAGSILIPESMGYRRAFEMFCLGGSMAVEEAVSSGFITRVVPAGDLETQAKAAARRLSRVSPVALKKTRDLMKGNSTRLVRRASLETAIFCELLDHPRTRRRLKAMARAARTSF